MVYSMTGFGRGSSTENGKTFIVEIKSVNHRYLDINIKMPRVLLPLEDKIRKVVSSKLKRGKVDIYITQKNYSVDNSEAILNKSLLESYINCLNEIKEGYNLKDDLSIATVARFPEVLTLQTKEEDIENVWSILSSALEESLNLHVNMRLVEGEKLCNDMKEKCRVIKEQVSSIEEKAPLVVNEYREKLHDRLSEILEDGKVDESRIAMEVALFADKAGIDEEITRLYSHLDQIHTTLELNEAIGRKLDFIVQEMNRETNTIGSKANNLEILNKVLTIKNEIEKIREQIQNIE
ncbi:TIGR00255 family protein [Clostridium collagenovorans DSM 3089]|uniref:TIGR00255 family protein n=1 Tax=Clostridium collagenovorans DSM 3089 TaxID=1121306 RepID=A0A1M5SRD4_9CLOT|nr:YicC/YloC family endoribonuclease [Clostridium collagenovorans]SHH41091.1 TIGR00255 family protein [Clostridium collagenovorans DSM 3089]